MSHSRLPTTPLGPSVTERLRAFIHGNFKRARRIAVFVIGTTTLIFGLVLFFTPGPAIIVIPAGLAILATEFLWARRLLQRFRRTAQAISTNHRRLSAENAPYLLGIVLLGCAFAYQLGWCWLASVPQIVGNITNDDTFLYLEFARNTVKFGFPTFDGVNETNGAQPLWGGVLVLLASFVSDKAMLLRAALSLCAVLNVATGLVLLRAAARLRSDVLAAVAGVCWACYMLGLSPSMLGMENSLHAFIASLIMLHLIDLLTHTSRPSWGAYLSFGCLLALNALTRLDSGVVGAVLGLVVLRRGSLLGTRMRTLTWLIFGPTAIAACLYLTFNESFFGTALPVSGLMKAFYADHYLDGRPAWYWPLFVLGAVAKTALDAPEWVLSEFAPEGLEPVPVILVLAIVLIPLALRLTGSRLVDRSDTGSSFTTLCKTLALATVLHMLTLSATILHFSTDQWYHSWLLLTWIIVLAWAIERWSRSPVLNPPVKKVLATALVVVLAVVQIVAVNRQLSATEARDLFVARLAVADWISQHVPRDVELASWNAGQLAYFTDHTLVNLDGLMNSGEYAEFITSGGDARAIIDRMGIDAVVDYDWRDSTKPTFVDSSEDDSFRNVWKWDQVAVLHCEPLPNGKSVYVLDLPGGEIPDAGNTGKPRAP